MVDIDQVHKKERYLDESGNRDWIDKCALTMSQAEFRGAMMFTIGKYYQRMGKKDPIEKELAKIADYRQRWIDYELKAWNAKRDARPAVERMVDQYIRRVKAQANGK